MKGFRWSLLLLTANLLSAGIIRGQGVLTLDDALQQGLKNNFGILLARNDLQIARNNNTHGNAGFLPRVEVTSGYNTNIQSIDQTPRNGAPESLARTTATLAGALQLSWTLFDGLAMFATKEQLTNMQLMGDLKYRMAVEDAVASIMVTYYSIAQQEKLISSLRESYTISKTRLAISLEKARIGAGYELQAVQAEVDLRADSSALLRQENSLKNLMVEMNRNLGRDPNIFFSIESTPLTTDTPELQQLLEGVNSYNSELLYERALLTNRDLGVRISNAQRYPKVALSSAYSYSASDFSSGSNESYRTLGPYVGLTAGLTLFNGFNVNRSIKNAALQLENQRVAITQKENQLVAFLLRYYNDYQLAVSLVGTEEISMRLAGRNVEIALEKFRLGAASDLELRDTQKKLLDAQYRFFNAQLQAKTAEVELKLLAGNLISLTP